MKSIDLDPGLRHLRNRVSILLAAARHQLGQTEFAGLLGRQCAWDRVVSRGAPHGQPLSEIEGLHRLLDVVFRNLEDGNFRGVQLHRVLDRYERLAR